MVDATCIGRLVVGFDMSDPDQKIWHIGKVIGYRERPTVILDCGDQKVNWVADICRLATHDEEVAYWRSRAEAAEARARGVREDGNGTPT
jgi:hypothetical protein